MPQLVAQAGFDLLPITLDHVLAAGVLPIEHRDAFDRMLIAQALIEGLTIVTGNGRKPRGCIAVACGNSISLMYLYREVARIWPLDVDGIVRIGLAIVFAAGLARVAVDKIQAPGGTLGF